VATVDGLERRSGSEKPSVEIRHYQWAAEDLKELLAADLL